MLKLYLNLLFLIGSNHTKTNMLILTKLPSVFVLLFVIINIANATEEKSIQLNKVALNGNTVNANLRYGLGLNYYKSINFSVKSNFK
jgi:hypothetical protein